MRTSADNRRIRQLLHGIQNGEIVPRPDFQRNLVWSNKDKVKFIDTVLSGYPFPEIYIAAGDVNLQTAAATEMLVDGQQRVTTLHQYFIASDALSLPKGMRPYKDLTPEEQTNFLNYEVAVRNLGIVTLDEIREVFSRINSTAYSLNAMEIHNARYLGPLKQCAEDIAEDKFFENHRVFPAVDIKRMRNVVFALTVIVTMLSTYFNRDDEIEPFLERFNDEFPHDVEIRSRFARVRDFIEGCGFPEKSRVWKKTDLLVLLVELDRLLNIEGRELDAAQTGAVLTAFYARVEAEITNPSGQDEHLQAYFKTTVQATNDKSARVNRARVIRAVIEQI